MHRLRCVVALARAIGAVFVRVNGLATSFHRDTDELGSVSLSLSGSVEDLFGKDTTPVVK